MAHKILTDESFNEKLDGLIEAVGKGKQGDPGISATHSWEGTILTVTSASGTSSADLQGPQGPRGLQGVQGPQGEQGIQGVQGPAGEDGKNGADGKHGADGVSIQSATVNSNGRLILTLTDGKTIDCGVAKGADGQQGTKGDQGIQGPKGDPFSIAKTYNSVAEMQANFAIDEVPTGAFVLIDTGNVDDPDNAKLFYKGDYAYVYLIDLSGAQGIQGPQGIQGIQGPKGDTGSEGPQGPKGDQGIQGIQGPQGPSGKSAYEIWLANGNSGTEATFLASLKGAKGDQGEQGIQGVQGVQGIQGIQGEPGAKGDKGDPGISATHFWEGTVLTVTSASGTSSADLKGDKGDPGIYNDGTEGLAYTLNSNNTSMTCTGIGTATTTDIRIASMVDGLPVTSIGNRAFYQNDSLTSVVIPESVTSIGDSAFYGCSNLTSVVIGDGVTSIGSFAFYSCSNLISVTIPNRVTSIGECAFNRCSNLGSVNIPEGVTSIEAETFYDCSKLTRIVIPDSVTSIGEKVFVSCERLTSVAIGGSVTFIDKYAFWHSNALTKIKFNGTIEDWKAITFGTSWDSGTGEYTIYCLDGKIAKDGTVTGYLGGYEVATLDINEGLKNAIVPKSRKSIIPSLYSVEYAVREAMPVWIFLITFRAGKDLYPPDHADYNKLIFVANVEGKEDVQEEITGDLASAHAMASYFDRGYRITQVTRGFHNQIFTDVEFSYTTDDTGLKTYTVKIAIDADKQDALRGMTDADGGRVWLERYFSYFTTGYYIDQDEI